MTGIVEKWQTRKPETKKAKLAALNASDGIKEMGL